MGLRAGLVVELQGGLWGTLLSPAIVVRMSRGTQLLLRYIVTEGRSSLSGSYRTRSPGTPKRDSASSPEGPVCSAKAGYHHCILVVSYFTKSIFSIMLDWSDAELVAKQEEYRQQ